MSKPNWKTGSGGGWEWEHCVDWPTKGFLGLEADVNACNKSEVKGKKIKGWMKCGLGSNPSAGLCSPYSPNSEGKDGFNCAWGQECYAITKDNMEPNWEDGQGGEWKWKKCVNWPNNDVNKCDVYDFEQKKIKDGIENLKLGQDEKILGFMKCGLGSNPSAGLCSPYSKDKFDCAWGQECYAITKEYDDTKPIWEDVKEGKDASGKMWKWRKCTKWPNNDVNKCKETAPDDTVGWMKCGIGSDPSTVWCSPYSDGKDKFDCAWGQDCYAIINKPEWVKWESAQENKCDGAGKRITLHKCNEWLNNDPKSCLKSALYINQLNDLKIEYQKTEKDEAKIAQLEKNLNKKSTFQSDPTKTEEERQKIIREIEEYLVGKPITKKWANCGIGSSPGGSYPGDPLTACSPFSAGVEDGFGCMWGQSCFAITEEKEDESCPKLFFTDPFKSTGSFFTDLWEKSKWIIIGIIVGLLILSSISAIFKYKFLTSSVNALR
jgi:hypothetical protein